MQQPLVLAIEPDLRQAAIVKRIVREKALADVAVVDSLDAAIEMMRTTMPDVLLLSALLSPRDEDELITHLKTVDNAGHLQTHTIPQLASALQPEGGKARGLLSAFRRKKEPELAPGCDPDLFADEIRVFLQRAAEKKREMQFSDHAAPDMRPSPAGPAPASRAQAPAESQGASSSWSSPFEWKPSNPSALISNPYSRVVNGDNPAQETAAPSVVNAEPLVTAFDNVASLEDADAMPLTSAASAMDAVHEASADASIHEETPAYADAPLHASAETTLDLDAPFQARTETTRDLDAPLVADAPVHTDVFARYDAPPDVETPIDLDGPQVAAPVHAEPAILRFDRAARADAPVPVHFEVPLDVETETPVYIDAPIHVAVSAPLRESGPRERRPKARDKRLGVLASWMRSERVPTPGSGSGDDLRALLGALAIPAAVAAVAYPRGVRIRRVRVPAAREPRLTEGAGAVILSKRLLAEQRERRSTTA